MKITLDVKLSDGSTQQYAYEMQLPSGVTVDGYAVHVDQVDQTDRPARNATYGKKSEVAQYGVGAVMSAAICGCMDPSQHVGIINRPRGPVSGLGPNVYLFTPRNSPNWPPTWPPRRTP